MFLDMRLNEDRRLLRVNAASQIELRDLAGTLTQFLRILRNGDRMQVNYAIVRIRFVLHVHKLLDRAEIVPDRQVAGWLYARKYTFQNSSTPLNHKNKSTRFNPSYHRKDESGKISTSNTSW